jgi:hypothetical protein
MESTIPTMTTEQHPQDELPPQDPRPVGEPAVTGGERRDHERGLLVALAERA